MQTLQITLPESVINDLESIKQKLVDLESNFTPKEPDDLESLLPWNVELEQKI